MNETKDKNIATIAAVIVICFIFGLWAFCTGLDIGKSQSAADLRKAQSELSIIQAINTELQKANSEYIETTNRLQKLTESSTGHIQLLEAGITKLEGIGKAKDGRISELEDRVGILASTIDSLEQQVGSDSEIIGQLLEQIRSKNKSDNSGINNNSNYSSDYHYKFAEEMKYREEL